VSFVLDNSIALAWCFIDEQTDAIMALLDRAAQTGAVAPPLWPVEALNALRSAERRKRIDAARRRRLADFLRALPITIDDEMVSRIWDTTARLAASYELTLYDAVYLELALRLDLPLATADQSLIVAAVRVGVPVLPAA